MSNLTLKTLLEAKELRAERQQALCRKYQQTLVSITLNLPGSNKNPPGSTELLNWATQQLLLRFSHCYLETLALISGPECLLVLAAPATEVKSFAQKLETTSEFSRLLDIDVFDATYQRLSTRPQGRNCFLCARPASLCIREQTHSLCELETYAHNLLKQCQQMPATKLS